MDASFRLPIATVLRALVLLAAVLLLLKQFGVFPSSDAGPDWPGLIAPLFYLWAFWAGAAVFSNTKTRSDFGPALVRGLQQMGAGLMLGAWFAILAEPALRHLMGNGFTALSGARFNLSLANLALAFSGLILLLLAQRGKAQRADLDGFV